MTQFSTTDRRKSINARLREEIDTLSRHVDYLTEKVRVWEEMGAQVLFQTIIRNVVIKMKGDGEL